MQKIKQGKIYSLLLFLTIWVYFSLNARYLDFPGSHLLRWIFPALLIILAIIKSNGKIAIPPTLFWTFSIAVLPSIFLSSYRNMAFMKYMSWIFILYGCYIFFISLKEKNYLGYYFHILVAVLIIYQVLNFYFVITGQNYDSGRANGITTNANTLGVYANLAYWAIVYKLGKEKGRLRKLLWFLLLLTTVMASIASGSRTAFVVLILNILITIIICFRKSPFFFLYIGLAVLAMYLVLSGKFVSLNITALNRLLGEGGTSRDQLWDAAISVWKEHQMFGVGYTVSNYYNPVEPRMAFHNSYISFLVECGLWGMIIFVLGVVPYIKNIIKTMVIHVNNDLDSEFYFVVIMLLNLSIAAWSESFMFAVGSTEGFVFWFLVAWIMAYLKLLRREKKQEN